VLVTTLPSHAGNGVAETICALRDIVVESCWRRQCRVMLVMALPWQLGHGMMLLLCHVGDGTTKPC
jgi:hypothetical protein